VHPTGWLHPTGPAKFDLAASIDRPRSCSHAPCELPTQRTPAITQILITVQMTPSSDNFPTSTKHRFHSESTISSLFHPHRTPIRNLHPSHAVRYRKQHLRRSHQARTRSKRAETFHLCHPLFRSLAIHQTTHHHKTQVVAMLSTRAPCALGGRPSTTAAATGHRWLLLARALPPCAPAAFLRHLSSSSHSARLPPPCAGIKIKGIQVGLGFNKNTLHLACRESNASEF